MVPKLTVTLAEQWAIVRARKARRRYSPVRPGMSANIWVEPSRARSGPSTLLRMAYDNSAGRTRTSATPRAVAFRASRMGAFSNPVRYYDADSGIGETGRYRVQPGG